MKIYLIGMPGSGKTTLGKQLADELKLRFIDLDVEIEKTEGKSIPEIFRRDGEDYFRKSESQTLRNLAASAGSFVLATGGGAPCFYDGIQVIKESGVSIFLNVPVSEMMKRLSSKTDRPLLNTADDKEKEDRLKTMLDARLPCYQKAVISLQNPTLQSVLEAIRSRV